MKEIPVGNKVAIVDDDDYAVLITHKWNDRKGYAVTRINGKTTGMHQLVCAFLPRRIQCQYCGISFTPQSATQLEPNHRNRNRLDNRKSNLEWVTHALNMQQRVVHKNGSSIYIGVYKNAGKWKASIQGEHERYHLGYYNSEEEAGIAYDRAARYEFGTRAVLNFPERDYSDVDELRRKNRPCSHDAS